MKNLIISFFLSFYTFKALAVEKPMIQIDSLKGRKPIKPQQALDRNEKVLTIRMNSEEVKKITVSMNGTILSFSSRPNKVILGRKGLFAIEYIENDLAITPLKYDSKSNLTVYLDGKRYTFDLNTNKNMSYGIILIRDSLEKSIQVRMK